MATAVFKAIETPRFGRRTFTAGLLAAGSLALVGDRAMDAVWPLPLDVGDPALVAYLQGVRDLPPRDWVLLVIAAAVLPQGANTMRALTARLPASQARDTLDTWSYRLDAGHIRAVLGRIATLLNDVLPADRAQHYGALLASERARLAAGGQVDYAGMRYLVTLISRETGMLIHPELADLPLVLQQHAAPGTPSQSVAALLAERNEKRLLAARFRRDAARLLAGAARRDLTSRSGPLTLLSGLGVPVSSPLTDQLIQARVPDLSADTLATYAVYFTAGDFLAREPTAPPTAWADSLPADQRAYVPTNTLSPRLSVAEIRTPTRAPRILWADVSACRTVVAELAAL
ncbi:MAG: hypothetical protein ACTHMR_18905 [Thermomicrobiales bacterium]